MSYILREFDESVDIQQSFQAGSSSSTLTRKFYIYPFQSWPEAAEDLLGGYQVVSNGLVRIWPHRHPRCPWLYCTGVGCDPFSAPAYVVGSTVPDVVGSSRLNDTLSATSGILTATYSLPNLTTGEIDSNGEEVALAQESWDFGGRALQLKGTYMKYEQTNDADDAPNEESQAVMMLPEITILIQRFKVLRIPVNAIAQNYAKINKSAITLVSSTFPAETVRFDGATTMRRLTTARGLAFYEVGYKFAVNPIWDFTYEGPSTNSYVGWNRSFNYRKGYWEYKNWKGKPTRRMYLIDEDTVQQTIQGQVVKGMPLLFDRRAN